MRSAIHEILKQYWGYDAFRAVQEDIINAVLQKKDVLALLPTGGGKSICFQVPALAQEGLGLVISPLIALMNDQVEQLSKRDIPAVSINSALEPAAIKRVLEDSLHGKYKFLYVSPERLHTDLFRDYVSDLNISIVAIDEAHCISQWGNDFRPAYAAIHELRNYLPKVPFIALTASATKKVQEDIIANLHLQKPAVFQQDFSRPNLSYSVFNLVSKPVKLEEILNKVPGTALVYCKTRRHTIDIASLLAAKGFSAKAYHAGLLMEDRLILQEQWINNEVRIIVCTNAFGMGIDKPDVRVVVHYDMPDCPENYYQEAGRAGRDGQKSFAVLLTEPKDTPELEKLIGVKYPEPEVIKSTYLSLMNYWQVPAGAGESQKFDLDIADFAEKFNCNHLQVIAVLKALEQEGLLEYNEDVLRPGTVQVIAGKDSLFQFEKSRPEMDLMIKTLLRSYSGILDQQVSISESRMAKLLRITEKEVVERLQFLNAAGLIHYMAKGNKPFVFLNAGRMYSEAFHFNYERLRLLKEQAQQRLRQMEKYSALEKQCRSKFLAHYFDSTIADCGVCDNCLRKKGQQLSPKQLQAATEIITGLLKGGLMEAPLLLQASGIPDKYFWRVMKILVDEGHVVSDLTGYRLAK